MKSENDGTSIKSAYVVSVIDGKSLIAVKVNKASALPPVPNPELVGTNIILFEPYSSLKSFWKYNVICLSAAGTFNTLSEEI